MIRKGIFFSAIICLFFTALFAAADNDYSPKVMVSDLLPEVGEKVTVKYSAVTDPDTKALRNESLAFVDDMEVLEIKYEDVPEDNGRKICSLIITFTSYKPLRIILPELELLLENEKTGEKNSVIFKEQYVNFSSLLKEGDDDIKDILNPFDFIVRKKFWYIYIAAVVLILLLLFVFFRFKKRKVIAKELYVEPWVKAIDSLESLKNNDLNSEERVKEFYQKLTDTFRIYVQERFSLMTLEKTTDEFVSLMRKNSSFFNDSQQRLLKIFLDRCDLIKFAREKTEAAQAIKDIDIVRTFVEETKPDNSEADKESKKT